MSPQFEWQAGDDDDQWEKIADTTGHARSIRRRRALWWGWMAIVAALVTAAACAYLIVRRRGSHLRLRHPSNPERRSAGNPREGPDGKRRARQANGYFY